MGQDHSALRNAAAHLQLHLIAGDVASVECGQMLTSRRHWDGNAQREHLDAPHKFVFLLVPCPWERYLLCSLASHGAVLPVVRSSIKSEFAFLLTLTRPKPPGYEGAVVPSKVSVRAHTCMCLAMHGHLETLLQRCRACAVSSSRVHSIISSCHFVCHRSLGAASRKQIAGLCMLLARELTTSQCGVSTSA